MVLDFEKHPSLCIIEAGVFCRDVSGNVSTKKRYLYCREAKFRVSTNYKNRNIV